jgi:hypothetical protein
MEDLIEKLNLKPTNIQTGQTVMYNITIYSLFDDFLIGECNSLGEQTPGKCIIWNKNKPSNFGYLYIDFLLDMPVDELKRWFYSKIN